MNYMTFGPEGDTVAADEFAAQLTATGFTAIRFVWGWDEAIGGKREAVKSPDAPAMLIRGLTRMQAGRKLTKPQADAVAKFAQVAK